MVSREAGKKVHEGFGAYSFQELVDLGMMQAADPTSVSIKSVPSWLLKAIHEGLLQDEHQFPHFTGRANSGRTHTLPLASFIGAKTLRSGKTDSMLRQSSSREISLQEVHTRHAEWRSLVSREETIMPSISGIKARRITVDKEPKEDQI